MTIATGGRLAAGLLAAAVALGGWAARADEGTPLTLDRALELGRLRSRDLEVERARLEQARAEVELAKAALFPVVTAQGRYTHQNREARVAFGAESLVLQPSEQLEASIGVTAPILAPAAWPALDAVRARRRAQEEEAADVEASVRAGVALAFHAAAIADEVVLARRSNVENAEATWALARSRHAADAATAIDVKRAELAAVRAAQLEIEAKEARSRAYRALGTWIGAGEGTGDLREFHVQASFPEAAPRGTGGGPPPDLESALERRADLRAIDLAAEAAEARRRSHAMRWAPTLSAVGAARVFNYDTFAGDRHSWFVGAQIDWTLFDGGARDAEVERAAAEAIEARARASRLRERIRDEIAGGLERLDVRRGALRAAERSVELAGEALALARARYTAGAAAQLELLEAQDALAIARESAARARYDLAIAAVELDRALGIVAPR